MHNDLFVLPRMTASRGTCLLLVWLCAILTAVISDADLVRSQDATVRTVRSLNGDWQFRRDRDEIWKTVRVPSSFESHEGTAFDGIGWYRMTLPEDISVLDNQHAIVRFDACATETEIFCNGQSVGQHLGGWTPFECDITTQLRRKASGQPIELTVRVDERVGHNSQGFLPVFAPHFGGIWQNVSLILRSDVAIDDLKLFARGDVASQSLRVEVPLLSNHPSANRATHIRVCSKRWIAKDPTNPWQWETIVPIHEDCLKKLNDSGIALQEVQLPVDVSLWSPSNPALYVCRVELLHESSGNRAIIDQTQCRSAFRTITANGERILLNGNPISIRGVLNWGYAPPDTAPSTSEMFWQNELELVRSYGFNLMKFCLWVPPKRYLELADEQGVLTWMEYPTWHSQWSADQLPTLLREFREFFQFDRNHPSVVLRSLTCETGPSADLDVIRTLYDECHRMIPGCLVEDDSSWIEWNRIHDFYDDHPYGNNHTWVPTIRRLNQYVREHGVKPLVLGECIAADTWLDPNTVDATRHGDNTAWLPRHFEANQRWMQDRKNDMSAVAVQSLEEHSERYALEMRKYQIETLRREAPGAGYVVSVIRDFPFAEMGLLDLNGEGKWNEKEWAWHSDSMLLMRTKNDRRSFFIDEILDAEFVFSTFSYESNSESISATAPYRLQIEFKGPTDSAEVTLRELVVPVATSAQPGNYAVGQIHEYVRKLVTLRDSKPTPLTISASLTTSSGTTSNQWVIWVFPRKDQNKNVRIHASCDPSIRESLTASNANATTYSPETWLAQQFDLELLDRLESGANVLMIPNGSRNSFPQQQHWFLRGGPIVRPSKHFGTADMWNRLQAMDLGGPVVPNLQWLDQLTPYVMLWDNHDIDHVRTHGLLFATGVGKGKLLVCSLPVTGDTNAVGNWLFHQCCEAFADPELCSTSLGTETIQAIRNQLTRRTINLTDQRWMFRPDPNNDGLTQGWGLDALSSSDPWKPIQIGKHWEGQGYASLDGWAWYRLDVDLPAEWREMKKYLWVDGGDDYYEVFVNGKKIGSAGDIEQRKTAFEIRSSFAFPSEAGTDSKLVIAIRVHDWQGAGGMFRPIVLSTTDRDGSLEILR